MKYLFSNLKAILFCLILACAGAGFAQETPPQKVNFQGRLTDLSDNPLNGTYDLTFSLYNAAEGGTALWTETQTGVAVANGAMEAVLGSVTAIPWSVAQSSAAYLEIQVGSEVLAPRQSFNSVLYAMNAAALAGRTYDVFVDTYTAQSVSGIKTFRDNPVFNDNAIAQIKVSGLITALSAVAVDTTTLKSQVDAKQPLSANLTYLAANDGSRLTGISGDGLGSHVATATLNMAGYPVINVSTLIVTNAVSAGYFVGNGAGLSGVPGDNLGNHTAAANLNMSGRDIVSVGTITAASFVGNGSQLTGISGADNLGSHIATQDLEMSSFSINGIYNINAGGQVSAGSFVGDGSRLTGIAGGQGDNLGDHYATKDLNMGGFAIWSAGNVSITGQDFSVNGSTLVVTGGKMGIGTLVPGQNATAAYGRILHIYDDTPGVYPGIFIEDNDTAPGARWFVHAHGDGRNSFAIRDDVNAYEPLYIQDTDIGIGTDDVAPWARLHVNSTSPVAGSNIFMVSVGSPYEPTSLLAVKSDGKVGVGSLYPEAKLDVTAEYIAGTAAEVPAQIWRNNGGTIVSSVSASGIIMAAKFVGDGSGLTGIAGGQGDNLGNHTATQALNLANNELINVATMSMTGPLNFSGGEAYILSAADQHIAIMPTGAGNVGIGTVSPAEKLTVSGNIKASGNLIVGVSPSTITIGAGAGDSVIYLPDNQGLTIMGTRESYGTSFLVQTYNAAKTAFLDRFAITGSTETAYVYALNSNVGIGTASPDARLTILDGDIHLTSSTYDHGIRFADGTYMTTAASGADNLGNHTATQALNMAGNNINGAGDIAATGDINGSAYQINGSTVLRVLPGTDNLFVGIGAGFYNTGNYNAFMGYDAGFANTAGANNTFVGHMAGNGNTTGVNNAAFGNYAGLYTQKGGGNTMIGAEAGKGVISNSFSSSTLVGYSAGSALTTGSDNVFLGWQAGYTVTTGTGNIIIGYNKDAPSPTSNNQLNIGGVLFGDLSAKTLGINGINPPAALSIWPSYVSGYNTNSQVWYSGAGLAVATMTASGYMSAVKFYGDGSGLTGISSGVQKTGDTMTGPLTLAGSTLTVTGTEFSVGGSTFVVKNGFVGIGTNNPITPLFVQNASDVVAVLRTENSSKYTDLQMQSGTNMWAMVNNGKSDNSLYFEWYNTGIAWNQYVTFLTNGNVGISTGTPQARLDVMAAGSAQADMAQIWRNSGGTIVSSVSATGVVTASKFIGNGSGLTNIAGDNLGNHVAINPLNMAGYPILNVSSLTITSGGTSLVVSSDVAIGSLLYTSNGRLGIGTNTPYAQLQMNAAEQAATAETLTQFTLGATGSWVKIKNASSADGVFHPALEIDQYTDSGDAFTLTSDVSSDGAVYGPLFVMNGTSAGGTALRPLLEVRNAGVRQMMLTGTGQLGVGTAYPVSGYPSANLHVSSMNAASSQDMFKVSTGAVNADIFVIKGSGYVGIGEPSPSGAKLVVQNGGDGTPGLKITTTGTKPACDASTRGSIFVEQGMPDQVFMCLQKNAASTYQWVLIARGE